MESGYVDLKKCAEILNTYLSVAFLTITLPIDEKRCLTKSIGLKELPLNKKHCLSDKLSD